MNDVVLEFDAFENPPELFRIRILDELFDIQIGSHRTIVGVCDPAHGTAEFCLELSAHLGEGVARGIQSFPAGGVEDPHQSVLTGGQLVLPTQLDLGDNLRLAEPSALRGTVGLRHLFHFLRLSISRGNIPLVRRY